MEEYSNKRAKRVVESFINCVQSGEFTHDYACLLIEDNAKYGFLSESDKEHFYFAFENSTENESE